MVAVVRKRPNYHFCHVITHSFLKREAKIPNGKLKWRARLIMKLNKTLTMNQSMKHNLWWWSTDRSRSTTNPTWRNLTNKASRSKLKVNRFLHKWITMKTSRVWIRLIHLFRMHGTPMKRWRRNWKVWNRRRNCLR
jgi:hypothetical protein